MYTNIYTNQFLRKRINEFVGPKVHSPRVVDCSVSATAMLLTVYSYFLV
jgi:hypothetical protein